MKPFLPARELLESIPGFSQILAEIFIAETGGGMAQFPTAGHLASWAGVSPGSDESAGRVKSTKTRPGNRYLKGALGIAALNQARTKKTYFSAKYRRDWRSTRGPMKALVAVEHSMLTAAWNMLSNGEFYRDPGPDYYTRHDPAKTKARAVKLLEALGIRRHPRTPRRHRLNNQPQQRISADPEPRVTLMLHSPVRSQLHFHVSRPSPVRRAGCRRSIGRDSGGCTYVGDRRQGPGQDASVSSRSRMLSKIFWRPSWPLVAASSRWRCRVGRNSMVVTKKLQDSQMDSKWQSISTGRAQ